MESSSPHTAHQAPAVALSGTGWEHRRPTLVGKARLYGHASGTRCLNTTVFMAGTGNSRQPRSSPRRHPEAGTGNGKRPDSTCVHIIETGAASSASRRRKEVPARPWTAQ